MLASHSGTRNPSPTLTTTINGMCTTWTFEDGKARTPRSKATIESAHQEREKRINANKIVDTLAQGFDEELPPMLSSEILSELFRQRGIPCIGWFTSAHIFSFRRAFGINTPPQGTETYLFSAFFSVIRAEPTHVPVDDETRRDEHGVVGGKMVPLIVTLVSNTLTYKIFMLFTVAVMRVLTAEILPVPVPCFTVSIPFWYMSTVIFVRADEQAATLAFSGTIAAGIVGGFMHLTLSTFLIGATTVLSIMEFPMFT